MTPQQKNNINNGESFGIQRLLSICSKKLKKFTFSGRKRTIAKDLLNKNGQKKIKLNINMIQQIITISFGIINGNNAKIFDNNQHGGGDKNNNNNNNNYIEQNVLISYIDYL